MDSWKVIFFILLTTFVGSLTAEEFTAGYSLKNAPLEDSNKLTIKNSTTKANFTGRKSRQLNIDRIELPFSETEIKKHIFRIPPSVSKVRLIGSIPSNGPRTLARYHLDKQIPINYPSEEKSERKASQVLENYDRTQSDPLSSSEDSDQLRRNFNTQVDSSHQRISREKEENLGLGHYFLGDEFGRHTKYRSSKRALKKRKILNDGSVNFNDQEYVVLRHPQKGSGRDDLGFYEYGPMESIRYIKQFPSGLYGLKTVYAPNVSKQTEKNIYGKYYETGNRATPLTIKKFPGKLKKTLLNPQYTTHNSEVATNFGLSESTKPYHTYVQNVPNEETSTYGAVNLDFKIPIASASENTYPILAPEIQVIHPPNFAESSGISPPQRAMDSQKATIRDILEQDCPDYEILGFCESPPRYPMHQINVIVKKCAALMDVMGTSNFIAQQKYVEPSERSDSGNNTIGESEFNPEKHIMRKASTNDGMQACRSHLSVIEPGYAKEETTGKWFVVVQFPEITYQRLTTDTCKNPGKPCSGLSEMKCMRTYTHNSNFSSKSTKCVQKYAYHKLISWDPDLPEACPRMRIFKFPSACVCHVGIA